MVAVIPFPGSAHVPPEPPARSGALPLDAGEREALLAGLEVAVAVCAGNGGAARRMVLSYVPEELGQQLDALADRVFSIGRQPAANVWQQVFGSPS